MALALHAVAVAIGGASSLEMYALHGGHVYPHAKLGVIEVDMDSGDAGNLLAAGTIEQTSTTDGQLRALACGPKPDEFFVFENEAAGSSTLVLMHESRVAGGGVSDEINVTQQSSLDLTPREYRAAALDPTDPTRLFVTTECIHGTDTPPCELFEIDLTGSSSPVDYLIGGIKVNGVSVRIHDIAFGYNGYESDGSRALYGIHLSQLYKINTADPSQSEQVGTLSGVGDGQSISIEGDTVYTLDAESPSNLRAHSLSSLQLLLGPIPGRQQPKTQGTPYVGSPVGATICPLAKLYGQCNKFIECVDGYEVEAGTTTATGRTCAEACLAASGQTDRTKSNCCVSHEDPAPGHDNSCRGFTGKVCADQSQKSCAGFGSCIEATIGEVVDGCDAPDFPIFLGNRPNNQINACRHSTIDKVISSCHGQKSCFQVVEAGNIQNSCFGDYSCHRLAWGGGQHGTDVGVVVDEVLYSCIGSYACSAFAGYGLTGQHHIPVPVHVSRIAYSCRGSHACHELPGSPVTEANGSCNTNNACEKYDKDKVESVLVCKCPTSDHNTNKQKCLDAGYGTPEDVPADRCIDPDGSLSICLGEGVCGWTCGPGETLCPALGCKTLIGKCCGAITCSMHSHKNLSPLSSIPVRCSSWSPSSSSFQLKRRCQLLWFLRSQMS